MPDLEFRVERGDVLRAAAAPTLLFQLQIENRLGEPVRSLVLTTQIRIPARQRSYSPAEQARLSEVFGPSHRWAETLSSLLWTHTTLLVPAFHGATVVNMPVPCTYDFEVASTKYFHGLEEGDIPLEFLFSGTVFYDGAHGLQVVQIPWEKEARFQLSVTVWKSMMEHYFPNSAWLRLRHDVFDRLYAYRCRHGFPTWEATLEALLGAAEGGG